MLMEEYGEYQCVKENGTKYYMDNSGNVFAVINGQKIPQGDSYKDKFISGNQNAKKYYADAIELKKFIEDNHLDELRLTELINPDTGERYQNDETNPYTTLSGNGRIFDFSNIESQQSNFNIHRRDVIKNSIERNLAIIINNFNNFSNVPTDFRMPKLKEIDWDTIMENISVISFMQGVNIGGKIYSGYSIISNNKNEDIVMPDSIYIKTSDSIIHRITEEGLSGLASGAIGVFNVNLERRTGISTSNTTNYYFPIEGIFSYESIVTQNGISEDYSGDLNEYIQNYVSQELQNIYYTALARERYGLYRQKL